MLRDMSDEPLRTKPEPPELAKLAASSASPTITRSTARNASLRPPPTPPPNGVYS